MNEQGKPNLDQTPVESGIGSDPILDELKAQALETLPTFTEIGDLDRDD